MWTNVQLTGKSVSVGTHGMAFVEQIDGGYVLECECGWRSPFDASAEVVGTAWDEHRDDAA
jgi:hypothetical protein